MAKAAASRRVALALLGDIRRRDAYAREVLRGSERMDALEPRDRALAERLVMGVMGSYGLLDATLGRHVKGGARLEPRVRDALRLSTYELLFLAAPDAVVVSQGVELVRSIRPRAAGMANAVLRKVAREDVPVRARAVELAHGQAATVGDLVSVSGYPAWLLEKIWRQRGVSTATAFALSALDPAPVFVADMSPLRGREEGETRSVLAAQHLEPHDTDVPGAYRIGAPAGLFRSGLVQNGDIVVADLSAQLVALMVDPAPDKYVLEIGQGRGTKSLIMEAAAMRRGGAMRMVGVDALAHKTKASRNRMRAAGISDRVRCLTLDGTTIGDGAAAKELEGPFDAVLVDAPCSGTGTLRRHPERAWALVPGDVDHRLSASLPSLQLSLLEAAASQVGDEGLLCYATCSVLREENEDIVEAFLASEIGSGFERVGEPFVTSPVAGGPDGHFCMRLRSRRR